MVIDNWQNVVAMTLSVIGILLFIAGNRDILPKKYASFGGIVFLMLAGLVWAVF